MENYEGDKSESPKQGTAAANAVIRCSKRKRDDEGDFNESVAMIRKKRKVIEDEPEEVAPIKVAEEESFNDDEDNSMVDMIIIINEIHELKDGITKVNKTEMKILKIVKEILKNEKNFLNLIKTPEAMKPVDEIPKSNQLEFELGAMNGAKERKIDKAQPNYVTLPTSKMNSPTKKVVQQKPYVQKIPTSKGRVVAKKRAVWTTSGMFVEQPMPHFKVAPDNYFCISTKDD